MNIGILTSSRADFGIYLPLLKKLKSNQLFNIKIIAFGTHLSYFHGLTINEIEKEGFTVKYKIESLILGDSEESVSTTIGVTQIKFATFWSKEKNNFDIVFALGDRYEMYAAISAAIPFNIKFAHIHGGEKSLGAIDNIFRHAITLMSQYHFVSTNEYANRVKNLLDEPKNIFNVGALSLDSVQEIKLFSKKEIKEKWGVNFTNPTILLTLHPETIGKKNKNNAIVVAEVIESLTKYHFIITMPNADYGGNEIREIFETKFRNTQRVKLIENFGTKGYFSCLKNCALVMGNSSSGIIEAASFKKYVINIGDRQKGRAVSNNVLHVKFDKQQILAAVNKIELLGNYKKNNIYWNGGAGNKIIEVLETL